jgi:hypothetical protein
MQPNLIAPQQSITGKGITARAWNIQPVPNSIRKTRVNLATKLTKKASSKNRFCKIEPQQHSWGYYFRPIQTQTARGRFVRGSPNVAGQPPRLWGNTSLETARRLAKVATKPKDAKIG